MGVSVLRKGQGHCFRVLVAVSLMICSIFGAIAGSANALDIRVEGIRFGINQDKTRLVIELNSDVKPTVFALNNPDRIVIDMPAASWHAARRVETKGVISKYRYGMFNPETFRIVLDLKTSAVVDRQFVMKPAGNGNYRLVIDLKSATRAQYTAHVKSTKAARDAADRQQSAGKTSVEPPLRTTQIPKTAPKPKPNAQAKRIIVVDPGHGGNDPGNLGSIGIYEKDVVLAISKELEKRLEATGRYDVRLTRTSDVYIRHSDRFQMAEGIGAQLFISIHADSFGNASQRGASVYTLNERGSDVQANRVARRENQSDILAGVEVEEIEDDVVGILADLALTETLNFSAQFAEFLVPELKKDIRVLGNTHREANFKVLKSFTVPSVLFETGYLTNRTEAKFLNSVEGRRKIAVAVQRAVDRYFANIIATGN